MSDPRKTGLGLLAGHSAAVYEAAFLGGAFWGVLFGRAAETKQAARPARAFLDMVRVFVSLSGVASSALSKKVGCLPRRH